MIAQRVFVLGGARSGKSSFAESQFEHCSQVDYVATSQANPSDPEWQERIAKHRQRRPLSWTTIETIDLVDVISTHSPTPVLIDCLTVWLTRQMDRAGIWTGEPGCDEALITAVDQLCDALRASPRHIVIVSNEVGQGIVPADEGTRRFRDEMGIANAKVAAACDQVFFCVAGIATRIK